MAVLKFNTPPEGPKIDKALVGQNRGLQQAHGENIALQQSLGGEPLHPQAGFSETSSRAVLSTAPYRPPDDPSRDPKVQAAKAEREGRCKGNDDTCNAWAHKSTGYCRGHEKSLGII